MRNFKISVNGNWHEIQINDLDERPISVLVDGELYEVELAREPTETATVESDREEPAMPVPTSSLEAGKPALRQAQARPQDATAAPGEVIAPMPGKILAIHVTVGDWVQHQDVLCTLEAMKMENEIMAPAAGVVKEVSVIEGQDVLYGDVLLVIG